MAQFEGRLDKAPIVYALCQISFSPIEKIAEFVPDIQEKLRGDYPNFQREQIGGVVIAPNSQPIPVQNEQRWRFETRDQKTGYVLYTNQLITHTTGYVDFEQFLSTILSGFSIVHEVVKIGFIQRIGLRYVDLIVAEGDESLEDYIHPQLVGFRPAVKGLVPDVSQQFVRIPTTMGGNFLVKTSRGRHSSELPVELLPVPLFISRKPDPQSESIFLDWDHYIEQQNIDPEVPLLTEKLRALKAPIAAIFKEAISDYALRQWRHH